MHGRGSGGHRQTSSMHLRSLWKGLLAGSCLLVTRPVVKEADVENGDDHFVGEKDVADEEDDTDVIVTDGKDQAVEEPQQKEESKGNPIKDSNEANEDDKSEEEEEEGKDDDDDDESGDDVVEEEVAGGEGKEGTTEESNEKTKEPIQGEDDDSKQPKVNEADEEEGIEGEEEKPGGEAESILEEGSQGAKNETINEVAEGGEAKEKEEGKGEKLTANGDGDGKVKTGGEVVNEGEVQVESNDTVPIKQHESEIVSGADEAPDDKNPSPQRRKWRADQRVAWLVPFLSAPAMPPYAAFCLRTMAFNAPYLQVFVFYENASMILPPVTADNIHYISIEQDELAMRLIKVMKSDLGELAVHNNGQAVTETLRADPRKVGIYKPLLGAAFQDHIRNFSHWAWGDIDTLVGDVASLVSSDDLQNFDIISFNTGSGLLYLQGQLTILANRPEVNHAWRNASESDTLATSKPAYAWEETKFTDWVLHKSPLWVKLMPLQYSGKNGVRLRDDKNALLWDRGRLLLHFSVAPTIPRSFEARVEAPLRYQGTWTSQPQRPGPYVLERYGSNQHCTWYGSLRPARGYDNRTQEFIIFHYNYLHEQKIPSALEKKSKGEIQKLMEAPRLTWQYSPFDFQEAPPCGTPGGGHCPLGVIVND